MAERALWARNTGFLTICLKRCSVAIERTFLRRRILRTTLAVFKRIELSCVEQFATDSTRKTRMRWNWFRQRVYLCLWLLQKICVGSSHKMTATLVRFCDSAHPSRRGLLLAYGRGGHKTNQVSTLHTCRFLKAAFIAGYMLQGLQKHSSLISQ